jgi:hypothetical protein
VSGERWKASKRTQAVNKAFKAFWRLRRMRLCRPPAVKADVVTIAAIVR